MYSFLAISLINKPEAIIDNKPKNLTKVSAIIFSLLRCESVNASSNAIVESLKDAILFRLFKYYGTPIRSKKDIDIENI